MAKAPYIEEGRLRHLLKVAAVAGESPLRNVALLTTVYGTGMMLTEIARMPVRAYLNGDGSVRVKSCVDAAIAYNRKERPIYWSNTKVVKALDSYLEYRVAHRQRLTPMATAFRGLDPDGPIFLTGDGEPYKLIERRTGSGAPSYSCDSLSQLFRKLHLQAGIEGASAMSGRRTFAVRLANNGFDLRHINELLGHETLTATKRLIDADPVNLRAIVARVI
ncbi:tyrosine-type recombinase/integrase [Massilia sp. CT11-137]|uniref:tyrosine-type recombinase/integrase n=1 Tax=Massilia sp. CT11-137 TaxID=3393901 RepID=UPI0039B0EBC2